MRILCHTNDNNNRAWCSTESTKSTEFDCASFIHFFQVFCHHVDRDENLMIVKQQENGILKRSSRESLTPSGKASEIRTVAIIRHGSFGFKQHSCCSSLMRWASAFSWRRGICIPPFANGMYHTTLFNNKRYKLNYRCAIGRHKANEAVIGGIRRVFSSPLFWYAHRRKAKIAEIAAGLVLDARRAEREGGSQHISPSSTHPSHIMDAATTTCCTKNLNREERQ